MCILSPTAASVQTPAQDWPLAARQQLALDALAGLSISQLAQQHQVSRTFVSRQVEHARQALDQAFAPPPADGEVLFVLPVTRAWLRSFVLGLVLTCHSSFRGVQELLRDHFDYSLSLGTVHNVVQQAVPTARVVNARQDLSAIHVAAHDELFQAQRPVLVGVDVASTYCYLLSQEAHRDADTWAVHLWDLQAQGFAPASIIADGGQGLRAGQARALPETPCRADIFHAERDFGQVVRYLENRAYQALTAADKLQRQSPYTRRLDDIPKLSADEGGTTPDEEKYYEAPAHQSAAAIADTQDSVVTIDPGLAERLAGGGAGKDSW